VIPPPPETGGGIAPAVVRYDRGPPCPDVC